MYSNSFTLKLHFQLENLRKPEISGEQKDVGGTSWFCECHRTDGGMKIKIKRHRQPRTLHWAQFQLTLIVKIDKTTICCLKEAREISHNISKVWKVESEKRQGDVFIEATICVIKTEAFDLSRFQKGLTDVKVELQDKVFHASKLFLSIHSSYFNTMFDSNAFLEAQTGVCKLLDIKSRSFLILLYRAYNLPVDYPSLFKNAKRFAAVVELADRLQFDGMLVEIEDFLITLPDKKVLKWKEVAEKFRLTKVLHCIEKLKEKIRLKLRVKM